MKALAFVVFLLMPAIGLLFFAQDLAFPPQRVADDGKDRRLQGRALGRRHRHGQLQIPADRLLPDERGRKHRVTLSHERPIKWKGVREDEIKLIYQRGDPQHPKIAHWSPLWLVPILLFAPAILLLIALGWLILVSKLPG